MGTDSAQALRQSSNSLMWAGILALIIGIIAIAVPAVASVSIAILVGILVIVLAVTWLFAAIGSETSTGWKITGVVLSVLLLIGGLWILFNPVESTIGLTAVIAIVFIVMGVVRVVAAIGDTGGEGSRWLLALGGILAIILGILIAADWPSSAAWAIGLLVGIQFIFDGIGLILMSSAMKGALRN
ncbi:MAG: DUF308 domain-containing protein [Thermoleophilia bacterium]